MEHLIELGIALVVCSALYALGRHHGDRGTDPHEIEAAFERGHRTGHQAGWLACYGAYRSTMERWARMSRNAAGGLYRPAKRDPEQTQEICRPAR